MRQSPSWRGRPSRRAQAVPERTPMNIGPQSRLPAACRAPGDMGVKQKRDPLVATPADEEDVLCHPMLDQTTHMAELVDDGSARSCCSVTWVEAAPQQGA